VFGSEARADPTANATTKTTPSKQCAQIIDALARLECSKTLRVGVRSNYPPYSYKDGEQLKGFEIDLAKQLARELGADVSFETVTPANRLALLGEGRIDMVLATMGHTTQRDREARFIRPHYFRSETIVVGRKGIVLNDLANLRGNTICVTVGNNTNAELVASGARLMLFDTAPRLIDELRLGGCSLVAQDDSFFAPHFKRPEFSSLYDMKFGFARLPWGAAVSKEGGENLKTALSVAMQKLHANGYLEQLAQRYGVETTFLEEQRKLWASNACTDKARAQTDECLLPPRNNQLKPTAFAPSVEAFEAQFKQASGFKITLAMLKSEVALKIFGQGVLFTLALVAGSVGATLLIATLFAKALCSRYALVRWLVHCVVRVAQSTPMILLMILAGVLISAVGSNTALAALGAAVLMLGLANGSNAGQAVAETHAHMKSEGAVAPSIRQAMTRSRAQLVAFVVNATRGSPAASVIGVPELLSALTDISSFSSERITTYTLLLLFYMLLVSLVVMLGNWWLHGAAQKQLQEGIDNA
jgi:polar amino acid transport system substrate-binding protein